jgi:hypothetical protein
VSRRVSGCLSAVGAGFIRGIADPRSYFARHEHFKCVADYASAGRAAGIGSMDWTAMRLRKFFRRRGFCGYRPGARPDGLLFMGLRRSGRGFLCRRTMLGVPGWSCRTGALAAPDPTQLQERDRRDYLSRASTAVKRSIDQEIIDGNYLRT